MRVTGLNTNDVAVALGAIVGLSASGSIGDGSATSPSAVLGARAVHVDDLSSATPSYSVSSPSPSIDSCVVRLCSLGHRCSGTYTPRVTTLSTEPDVPNNESARPTAARENRGET